MSMPFGSNFLKDNFNIAICKPNTKIWHENERDCDKKTSDDTRHNMTIKQSSCDKKTSDD